MKTIFISLVVFILDYLYLVSITTPESHLEDVLLNKQKTALVDLPLFMSAQIQWQERIIERLLWVLGGFTVMFICFAFIFLIVR